MKKVKKKVKNGVFREKVRKITKFNPNLYLWVNITRWEKENEEIKKDVIATIFVINKVKIA